MVVPLPLVETSNEIAAKNVAAETASLTRSDLARLGDVPLLLTQMKQIAVVNGLGWTAADYRITPATDTQPSSLEVRSTFKGPYPKLRSMVSQVLRDVPAATLRELNLSRSSSDSADVEAKVVIAVLLQDEPTVSIQTRVKAAQ